MKKGLTASLGVAFLLSGAALANPNARDDKVVIGVVADMSGIYSAHSGPGQLAAVQMAIEDFGGKVGNKPIELKSADYQLKVDVGLSIASRWIGVDGVDMIIEGSDSATASALFDLGQRTKTVTIAGAAASTVLHNARCSPYGIHYVYDTYAVSSGTAKGIVQEGGKSWFFITADYEFGRSLEANTSRVVQESGGTILGAVRVPTGSTDFASQLLRAQSSGAQVVAFANGGADFVNAMKQAGEFGLAQAGQKPMGMLVFITDIKSLGTSAAAGLSFTTGFYWDMNDETRAWSDRYYAKTGARPSMVQAGSYSATMHYLNAAKAVGSEDAEEVTKWMKANPINDFFAKNGIIRQDGRMVHDMYLVQVKTGKESKNPWDLLKVVRTIPGHEAFLPLDQSTCPFVKKQ